jgi:hypothetical protein
VTVPVKEDLVGMNSGKYMVSQPKPGFIPDFFGPPATRIETFLKGSDEIAVYPHVHDFGEALGFFGCDPSRPEDLGGRSRTPSTARNT